MKALIHHCTWDWVPVFCISLTSVKALPSFCDLCLITYTGPPLRSSQDHLFLIIELLALSPHLLSDSIIPPICHGLVVGRVPFPASPSYSGPCNVSGQDTGRGLDCACVVTLAHSCPYCLNHILII